MEIDSRDAGLTPGGLGTSVRRLAWPTLGLFAAPPGYWLAWVATITFFAGFYALLVPLPRYLGSVGLADWQIGLVLGALGVASLIGRPIAGLASDRFGARQVLLAGSVSLMVGAMAVPTTADVLTLFILRLLQALGYVAFTTAGTALVVSLVGANERPRRLAVYGVAANLAISASPAASAALLEVAPVAVNLLVSGAFAALAGTLALRLPRSATSHPGADRPRTLGADYRRLVLPMLITGLLGVGFAAFFQFAPILADRRGVSAGPLYAVYAAAIITTRIFGGSLLDRVRIGYVVGLAAGLMFIGEALIGSSDGFVPLLLSAALIASGGGLFHPALIAHHAAQLTGAPGQATAAFYLAFDVGIGLGSWVLGVMLQFAGLPGLYWTAAALVAMVVPLATRLDGGLSRARL